MALESISHFLADDYVFSSTVAINRKEVKDPPPLISTTGTNCKTPEEVAGGIINAKKPG